MSIQEAIDYSYEQLAKELSKLTNQTWILQKIGPMGFGDRYFLNLKGGDGESIGIISNPFKKKITIFGVFSLNNKKKIHGEVADITCSMKKSPERVAQDIKKRFLTEYLTAFRIGYTEYCEWEAKRAARQKLFASLAKIIGYEKEIKPDTALIYGSGGVKEMELSTTNEVTLKLRVDIDKAKKILRIVAK